MTMTNSQIRADAHKNRERIVAAARAAFTEHGPHITLSEVARRAGVAPATLYRHFPTKAALTDAAFAAELARCRRIVLEGRADPSAWNGFVTAIRRLTAVNAHNRGIVATLASAGSYPSAVADHRRELLTILADIARDAQANGELRRDFHIDDLKVALLASRGLYSAAPDDRGRAVDRFAQLIIDAFRADARPAGSVNTSRPRPPKREARVELGI